MGGAAAVVRVRVRVVEDLRLRHVRVHALLPALLAQRLAQIRHRAVDLAPRRRQIDAQQPVLVLDDPAVHHDRVHIAALGLERHVAVGVEQRERDRRVVVLDQYDVGLPAGLQAAQIVTAERVRAPARGPGDDLLGAQRGVRDGVALRLRLEVLPGAVGAERGPHRGEQIAAPPDAGVHGQRHRDAVGTDRPGGRVALARALLALRRDGDRAPGRGDAVVGVRGERGGVHIDRLGGHEPVVVHQPDAVVAGRAPHTGVRGHRHTELAGHLEGRLLREGGVAGHVEGELEAEHVVPGDTACEVAELRGGRPLGGRLLDVAVGEDGPAGHRAQGVDGGVGVVDRLEAVRPVHDRRDTGVDRLDRGEQIAGVHVLGAEEPAGLQVVPDEVLGERPIGAVAAHRGLPHVAVGVDHAGHDDAVRGVDDGGALGDVESGTDGGDAVVDDQHVGAREHPARRVHRQYRPASQDHRSSRPELARLAHPWTPHTAGATEAGGRASARRSAIDGCHSEERAEQCQAAARNRFGRGSGGEWGRVSVHRPGEGPTFGRHPSGRGSAVAP